MRTQNILISLVLLCLWSCAGKSNIVRVGEGEFRASLDTAIQAAKMLGYEIQYVDKEDGNLQLMRQDEHETRTIRVEPLRDEGRPQFRVKGTGIRLTPISIDSDIKQIVEAMENCCGAE
jgi:hypothetical protein